MLHKQKLTGMVQKEFGKKGFWVAFYELEFQIPDTSSPHFMTFLMDHMAEIDSVTWFR